MKFMWLKISYFDVWPKLNILQENGFILRKNKFSKFANIGLSKTIFFDKNRRSLSKIVLHLKLLM
jgi:hypothetical protein